MLSSLSSGFDQLRFVDMRLLKYEEQTHWPIKVTVKSKRARRRVEVDPT